MKGCEQFARIFCQTAIFFKNTVNEIHQVTSSGRLYCLPFALAKITTQYFTKTVSALKKLSSPSIKLQSFCSRKAFTFIIAGDILKW